MNAFPGNRSGRLSAVFVACLLFVLACGGGGGGPSEPPGGGSLFGTWRGTMTGTRADNGQQITCTATWQIEDTGEPGVELGIGNWDASCSDATSGRSILAATRFLADLVVLVGTPGSAGARPFGGCGWGGNGAVSGRRFTGDWETASGQQNPCPVRMTGRFDLSR